MQRRNNCLRLNEVLQYAAHYKIQSLYYSMMIDGGDAAHSSVALAKKELPFDSAAAIAASLQRKVASGSSPTCCCCRYYSCPLLDAL